MTDLDTIVSRRNADIQILLLERGGFRVHPNGRGHSHPAVSLSLSAMILPSLVTRMVAMALLSSRPEA
ncbi:MAG: hypothetical protein WEG40_22415 [Candidatus Rokuibacteriota bacterium]